MSSPLTGRHDDQWQEERLKMQQVLAHKGLVCPECLGSVWGYPKAIVELLVLDREQHGPTGVLDSFLGNIEKCVLGDPFGCCWDNGQGWQWLEVSLWQGGDVLGKSRRCNQLPTLSWLHPAWYLSHIHAGERKASAHICGSQLLPSTGPVIPQLPQNPWLRPVYSVVADRRQLLRTCTMAEVCGSIYK
jgi:hypothetical protein